MIRAESAKGGQTSQSSPSKTKTSPPKPTSHLATQLALPLSQNPSDPQATPKPTVPSDSVTNVSLTLVLSPNPSAGHTQAYCTLGLCNKREYTAGPVPESLCRPHPRLLYPRTPSHTWVHSWSCTRIPLQATPKLTVPLDSVINVSTQLVLSEVPVA